MTAAGRILPPVTRHDALQAVTVDLDPLLDATRTINAVIVRSLATADEELTVPQLRVLVILTALTRASLSEVADDLGVNPSNASRTCDQLVRRGLVDRAEDPEDRRRLVLTLSPAGRRLLQEVMDRRRELLAVVVAAMSPEAQAELVAAMTSFNAAAEATGQSASRPGTRQRHTPWLG